MTWTQYFASLAFIFSVAAYVPYIKWTLQSKIRPTLSTWICWASMDIAILAAMIVSKEVAPQMVAYVIGTSFVLIACIYKKGVLGWKLRDTMSVSIVALAIFGWALSKSPEVAIVLSLFAAIVGSVPMMINIWAERNREPLIPWLLTAVGGFFGIVATWHNITLVSMLTPATFFVLQFSVINLILIRREIKK